VKEATLTTILNTYNATFHGVNSCFHDRLWQALLEFYCLESTDEMPHDAYHIQLDAYQLMALSIDVADDDGNEEEMTVVH
jgi:hypothetical protein